MAETTEISLGTKQERDLALALLRFPENVEQSMKDYQVNQLCFVLDTLSTKIGSFYTACKVLGSPEEQSRILLLEATRAVMKQTFDLLGMKTLERI